MAQDYYSYAQEEAVRQGVNPELVMRVMAKESTGNAGAVSPKGARGLMQVMPGTFRAMGGTNPNDPYQNIRAGVRYLRQNLDKYGGSVPLALAAYNAGPGRVDKARGVPNIPETRNYVQSVVSGNVPGVRRQQQAPARPQQSDLDGSDIFAAPNKSNLDGSDIFAEPVKKAQPAEKKQAPGFFDEIGRQIGLTGRALAEGSAGIASVVYDPLAETMNMVLPKDNRIPGAVEGVSRALDSFGIPKAQTGLERVVQEAGKTVTGSMIPVGIASKAAQSVSSPVIQKAMQIAASLPGRQLAGAAGAGAAGQASEEMGAGEGTQAIAALGGGLLGGGLAGMRVGKQNTGLADDVVNAGKQHGVRVFTSDVRQPKTSIGKNAQRVGASVVGTGTSYGRAAQEAERARAIRDIAGDFGADENAVADVAKQVLAKRGAELSKYSGMKSDAIKSVAGKGSVPVTRTIKAIDDQIAKLKALKTTEVDPVIGKLDDWKSAIQGQDIDNLDLLRKQVGESFKAPELAGVRGTGEKALSAIYRPLKEEMGDYIKTAGGTDASRKWQVANKRLSGLIGEIDNRTFKGVVENAESTPEDVRRMLFSRKGSDVSRLYKNLNPEGRVRARSAIIQEAIEKSGGIDNVSTTRFATQLDRLSTQTGVFFSKDDKKAIDGFKRLLQATNAAPQLAASPITGQLMLPGGLIAGGAGVGTATSPAVGAAAYFGTGLIARMYESPATRKMLMALPELKAGSAEESAILKRLMNAAVAMKIQNEEK